MRSAPPDDLALAATFAAMSFVCISAIELLSVHHVRQPVPWYRIVLTAIGAIGIGHAIGLAALSSGAIRYRMYGRAGLGIVSTGKIVVFAGLAMASGFAGIGGLALLWQAGTLAGLLDMTANTLRLIGIGALALLCGYFLLCTVFRGRFVTVWRGEGLCVPSVGLAAAHFLAAGLNILCIGGVLYAALRSFTDVHYATATALYVSGDVTALIAHVPGGWGVLEYIVSHVLDDERVLAGIVLYRAIYYLMPLCIGLVVFVVDELAGRRATARVRRAESVREAA
jgi:hypothetical protein